MGSKAKKISIFAVQRGILPYTLFGILPQYDRFKALVNMGDEIIRINNELEQHAAEGHYTYIDLHFEMTDGAGRLRDDFTNDGLHLMGAAYQHWADILRKLL